MTHLLLLTLACASTDGPRAVTPPPPQPAPSVFHGDRDDVLLPDFDGVTASDGSPRHREDLLGQPTAMWFYPAAGTAG